ncbi:MAG: group II intron reverse transcriptase/maturase [Alphaproteobacteria bacterium RIFCSPHIGHO2_12_42_13]|nr:MAG: group II intron reverse transcriptase/maturase [Alphaproteobacteria bacterium RIFCSPHIGHO2_12_FULL_42_100]OFW85456.1 MAG: group II intron reverse transcriptase/maturase [Alphaproteobacteria bacterium RBG_16_42_14]OFW91518.1 MAG: group II intron reverse transcriptase/maturase [Alphaproteobacteria bacterium RIFCSPHIGHO2_02_FULL_42_30]OFW92633.1 MAG: group II intron reverse transcriptase/maturase [Alphaproteobacteria bacterium RIFCSPHIGHO2_12_42_13]OFX03192.1 MAG: group II intron reverse t
MSAMNLSLTGASSATNLTWATINWEQVSRQVTRLQFRIAKAVREKRYGKVKALQWLLTNSFMAKLLAVRRVTQSSGSKTPGVDGVLWRTPQQKMKAAKSLRRRGYKPQPLRRIYISKKSGGLRPLSIPAMLCRAMQTLHLLALEPVAEMKADRNAYGFRPKRSTADAIEQCFKSLAKKSSAPWVMEGDIRACFDSLSGTWLQDNIPMDKTLLTKWLRAGYIEERTLHPTFNGVPQGGSISPCILVLAFSGLEETVKNVASIKDKVNVVSYADDFVITGASKEVLEHKVRPIVETFLKERGLELSPQKTKITHVDDGFDFLGFNVRKYKGKLLIKPSKKNVKSFLDEIRKTIKFNANTATENLIQQLNPKIRGWANYFRHVVAKETFSHVDACIFKAILRWIKKRHPKKNAKWTNRKYFRPEGFRNWIFFVRVIDVKNKDTYLDLHSAAYTPIRRHVKIKSAATPYDPQFKEYFLERQRYRKNIRESGSKEGTANSNVSRNTARATGSV